MPDTHIWAADLLQRIHWESRPAAQPLCQFIPLFLLFQWKRSLLQAKDNSSDSASVLAFFAQIFNIHFKWPCYELITFKEEYKTTTTHRKLYSISVINHNGEEYKERMCMYMCVCVCVCVCVCNWVTLLYSRNWHNTGNQLQFNKKINKTTTKQMNGGGTVT